MKTSRILVLTLIAVAKLSGILGCGSETAVDMPAPVTVEGPTLPPAQQPADTPEATGPLAPPTEGDPQIVPTQPAATSQTSPTAAPTEPPTEGAPAGE